MSKSLRQAGTVFMLKSRFGIGELLASSVNHGLSSIIGSPNQCLDAVSAAVRFGTCSVWSIEPVEARLR